MTSARTGFVHHQELVDGGAAAVARAAAGGAAGPARRTISGVASPSARRFVVRRPSLDGAAVAQAAEEPLRQHGRAPTTR